MRRFQAILVILALLATPLTLFASASCCCQTMCPICTAMQGEMAHCTCPMHNAKCGTNGKMQLPDFALASPLAPTVPQPFFRMTRPAATRILQAEAVPALPHGFQSPPFAPPRS